MRREKWLRAVVLASALFAGIGCGGDDGEGPSDPEPPEGDPCAAPGMTMTGCECSEEQPPGSRVCLESKVWSVCSCPSPRDCNPGQRVRCALCDGDTERRVVDCEPDGTYDCSCDNGSAGSG